MICSTVALAPAHAQNGPAEQTPAAPAPSAETGASNAEAPPPTTEKTPEAVIGQFTFGGEADTHLQAEATSVAHQPVYGTVFDDTDTSLYGTYSDLASLNANLKFERDRYNNEYDYYPDRNAAFRDEALTLRQLYLTLHGPDDVDLYGGKIHPAFGSAWDSTPGNFYNFGTDYEQEERIGFGAAWKLPDSWGLPDAKISLETFYLDTSFLSNSFFAYAIENSPIVDRPGHYTLSQYGPSNTESFDSYTAALRGGDPDAGFAYQASFTSEATDQPGGKREYGQSIGGSYALADGIVPFAEYTHFTNFFGNSDLDLNYLIGGATFTRGHWQFVPAAGLRLTSGSSHATDTQENFSINYLITDALAVGAGINHTNIAAIGSWTFGPSLTYAVKF